MFPALAGVRVYAFGLDLIGRGLLWLLSDEGWDWTRDDCRRRPLCKVMKAAETTIGAALLTGKVSPSVVVVYALSFKACENEW